MAPVKRTKWMTSTWDSTLGNSCVHWASRPTIWIALVYVSLLWSFSGQFFTCCCHFPPHPHPYLSPTHPLSYAGPKLVHTFKNDLKWPKTKQVTNFKLCHIYIKFNISISTILLNKAGLTQARLVILITTFKTRNSTIIHRCELGRFSRGWSHMRKIYK